jgi:hypothetical protein
VTRRYDDQQVTCTNERGRYRIQTDPLFGGMYECASARCVYGAQLCELDIDGHFDAKYTVTNR